MLNVISVLKMCYTQICCLSEIRGSKAHSRRTTCIRGLEVTNVALPFHGSCNGVVQSARQVPLNPSHDLGQQKWADPECMENALRQIISATVAELCWLAKSGWI